MGKNNRGASYPSIALNEAIAKLRIAYEKVGKGPSSKEEYVVGLGYSGLSGTSSRAFAALIHYGLLTKSGAKYEFTDLAMSILFPKDSAEPAAQDLAKAALRPKLFMQLFQRYKGQPIPTMLPNTLVIDYQIHDKSAQEAASNFRQSLDYANLLKGGVVSEAEDDLNDDHEEEHEENNVFAPNMPVPAHTIRYEESGNGAMPQSEDLNKIEIVLREGVKAGIYAPYNLTEAEKVKLKTIIDLL